MRRRRLAVLAVAASCAAVTPAAVPSPVAASVNQESTFQDDNRLIFSPPEQVAATLDELKTLGVDRIRVSVFWATVAPTPGARTKPAFDATDPNAYPTGSWDRYDTVVRLAQARGIDVGFSITSPAPKWATGTPARADIETTYTPNAAEYGLFVQAVARRFDGTYVQPGLHPAPPPLPRVDHWSIWNEPNQAGWLTPQWVPTPDGEDQVEAAPYLYRALADAGLAALRATGHGDDTLLLGETAPKGLNVRGETRSLKPGRFIRQVFCLDEDLRPFRGTEAELRQCPGGTSTSDAAKRFVAAHPLLFEMSGWAHHPYELTFRPGKDPEDDDFFTIGNLDELHRLMRRIYDRHDRDMPNDRKNLPLHITEYGYQTDPPDPTGVSRARQAEYLNEAEWRTARDSTVRSHAQFLLADDAPIAGESDREKYGSTFQTGLVTLEGEEKPAYDAYRLPVYLPDDRIRRGRSLKVWGLVRPATEGKSTKVDIQVRDRRKGAKWRRVKRVTVGQRNHYFDTRIKVRRSGHVRLRWKDQSGEYVRSRHARFTVRSKK